MVIDIPEKKMYYGESIGSNQFLKDPKLGVNF